MIATSGFFFGRDLGLVHHLTLKKFIPFLSAKALREKRPVLGEFFIVKIKPKIKKIIPYERHNYHRRKFQQPLPPFTQRCKR